MSDPAIRNLKKALQTAGFEVYRTLPDGVALAERVRDNLIMDSGVRVGLDLDGNFEVEVVLRAQASDFPGEPAERLLGRARKLAGVAPLPEYQETETRTLEVKDPGDAGRVLDTWHELVVRRQLSVWEDLVSELGVLLQVSKIAERGT